MTDYIDCVFTFVLVIDLMMPYTIVIHPLHLVRNQRRNSLLNLL